MEISGMVFLVADEDLLGGRMVALLQQHVIDVLALRREPEPARCQALVQVPIHRFLLDHAHGNGKIRTNPKRVKI